MGGGGFDSGTRRSVAVSACVAGECHYWLAEAAKLRDCIRETAKGPEARILSFANFTAACPRSSDSSINLSHSMLHG